VICVEPYAARCEEWQRYAKWLGSAVARLTNEIPRSITQIRAELPKSARIVESKERLE
jgi:hypothetical protein